MEEVKSHTYNNLQTDLGLGDVELDQLKCDMVLESLQSASLGRSGISILASSALFVLEKFSEWNDIK